MARVKLKELEAYSMGVTMVKVNGLEAYSIGMVVKAKVRLVQKFKT